jgi:predicted AlkP superfamily pyrophosphatase or phosphodiesterase
MVSLMNGSPAYLIELNRKFGYLRKGIKQPWLDNFVEASAHHTIKEKRPNVIMIHFVELDTMRHNFGYHSKEAKNALLSYDDKLFNMMKLLEDEGIMDKTTLFVLGDHDQIPVRKAMHLNSVFRAKGLIQTQKQKITDYDAYVKSEDGSAYVYLKNPNDTLMLEKVKTILQSLKERTDFGIEEIYSKKEAISFGANKNCSFMLEAKRGYIFEDSHVNPALMDLSETKKKDGSYGKSAHGFSPFKEDYQTVFFATGKGIKKNIHLESMRLIDEGPTFAHLMGTRLSETDGRILYEIIENE